MKNILSSVVIVIAMFFAIELTSIAEEAISNQLSNKDVEYQKKLAKNLFSQGITFIENVGQILDNQGNQRLDILYYSNINGNNFYFLKDRISVALKVNKNYSKNKKSNEESLEPEEQIYRYDMIFLNFNSNVEIIAEDMQTKKYNFFNTGKNVSYTNVNTYKKIIYKNLYPEIDLVIYGSDNGLKYDLIVHPSGDISKFRIKYDGISGLSLVNPKKLKISTVVGDIFEELPHSYVLAKRGAKTIQESLDCTYDIDGLTLSFNVPNYDREDILIIDPSLLSSSYIGATLDEISGWLYNEPYQSNLSSQPYFGGGVYYCESQSITNNADYFILAGSTYSYNFINQVGTYASTTGAYNGNWDVFIARYNVKQGDFDWIGIYGGNNKDLASDVIVTDSDQYIIVGSTLSNNFPTVLPIQPNCASCANNFSDAFILKLNNDGTIYRSTFWGGSGSDLCHGVDVDIEGNIYIIGETNSSDFPVFPPPPYQSCNSCPQYPDVFVCKFNEPISIRQWGWFYGGNGIDNGLDIKIARYNNIYQDKVLITGATNSNEDFPLANPIFDELNGTGSADYRDAFIAKMNALTGGLEWSTYFGGADEDFGTGIGSLTKDSIIIITGFTKSNSDISENFPINRVYPISSFELDKGSGSNAGDAFISIFQFFNNNYSLFISQYWGGSNEDRPNDLHIGKDGTINIAGYTRSNNFPLYNAFQNKINLNGVSDNYDAFYAKFAPFGEPIWSTYYGGSENDFGVGVAVTSSTISYDMIHDQFKQVSSLMDGVSVLGGFTESIDIPLYPETEQPAIGDQRYLFGAKDAFVASFSRNTHFPTLFGGTSYDEAKDIAIDADGYIYIAGITGSSTGFPVTPGVIQDNIGGQKDAFIAKFTDFGSLIYCSYLGGNYDDGATGVAVNTTNDDIFVVGFSRSNNLGYSNEGYTCYQYSLNGNQDAFLARISPDGDELRFFTYFGGDGIDRAEAVYLNKIDPKGVFVTGFASANINMRNGYETSFQGGNNDAFISRFNEDGSLIWSSYFGGSGDECGMDITPINYDNNIAFVGYTSSQNFPTTNDAYSRTFNGQVDGFLALLDSSGSILNYCTYIGGEAIDTVTAIYHARNWSDNVLFLTGHTTSDDFPIEGTVYQNSLSGNFDAFIVKFTRYTGDWWIQKSTYFGGPQNDFSYDICATPNSLGGKIYITGATKSNSLFSNPNIDKIYPTISYEERFEAYISRFDGYLNALTGGTYYGKAPSSANKEDDWSNALVLDVFNQPIITGGTKSMLIRDTSVYAQKSRNDNPGVSDAFVAKFNTFINSYKKESEIEIINEYKNESPKCCFDNFWLYPSPAKNDKVYLRTYCNKPETISLQIYNIIGQNIVRLNFNIPAGNFEQVIDISNLNESLYLVIITGSECQASFKLLIY